MIPLSPGQLRFWFQQHLAEGRQPTVPLALRIRGGLDRNALAAALRDVAARHESLRTVFPAPGGVPHQEIVDDVPALRELPVDEVREGALAETVAEVAAHTFDLGREPPLYARLLALALDDHVLVLVVHHVAYDAWSTAPLLLDLADSYRARRTGIPPARPEPPVQYADYTMWFHELLGDEHDPRSRVHSQLRFWAETLDGLPEQIALPTDRPRPATASHRGEAVPLRIDPNTHAAAVRLAQRHDATLFMVLQAGLAALLGRLGAERDVPLGTVVAGRTDSDLEGLVGFFMNTLVLRTDVGGDPTFAQLLDRSRAVALAAYRNQDVPFERVVQATGHQRSAARHPLFQVMLTLRNAASARPALHDLHVELLPGNGSEQLLFDLLFDLAERDGGDIGGDLWYTPDLFDRSTMESFAARYAALLRAATASPDLPVSRIDLLTPLEHARLAAAARATERSLPASTLPELFARRVAAAPGAVAVVDGGTRLGYAELDERSDRLAGYLVSRGAGPETLVALVMPPSADLVTAVLAVQKVGAAYLPIDPRQPEARVARMLADAHPLLVFGKLPEVVPLQRSVRRDNEHRNADAGWLAAAYTIYTSGSTGQPKGVIVTRSALVNLLHAMQRVLPIGPGDRLLSVTTPGFDIAQLELLQPLLRGATLVIADPDAVRDPTAMASVIADEAITVVQATPSLWSGIAELAPGALRGLRILVGGEPLPGPLARRLRSTAREVVNVYGPTETTIWSTAAVLDSDLDPPPIGRPLDNTRAHVLDAGLLHVPDGVSGELYLAGTGVARGYLGQAGHTAQRFVADPYGPPGTRMYRTGDLARRRADGTLDFLGRVDGQLKVRGFRIEPGEIETELGRHPDVGTVAVILRGRVLTAYVVPHGPAPDDLAAVLRQHAAEVLPEYMIPAVVVVDALPLTPNGKLDRAALSALPPSRPAATPDESSADPRERQLRELFAEVLGVSAVAAHDSFFDRGGDSITSIRLVARARSAGLRLSVRGIFRHRTPKALAAALETPPATPAVGEPGALVAAATGSPAPVAAVPDDDPVGTVPLTPMVHWLRDLGGPTDGYHQSTLLRAPPGLRENDLLSTVAGLLARHDALRIHLHRAGPDWRLHIPPAGDVMAAARAITRRVDVSGVPESQLPTLIEANRAATARLIGPACGDLVQVVWFDAGSRAPGRLLLTIHHLAVDGVSWRIVLADLTGRAPHTRGLSFRGWSRLLHREAPGRTAELPFWRDVLDGGGELLPGRRLDPGRDVVAGRAVVERHLAPSVTEPLLSSVPAALGAGVGDVLLAALAVAVQRWRGAPILIDVEGHGREDIVDGIDLTPTVGWFTSMFPVRLEGGPDPARALDRILAQREAAPHHGLGFGLLRYLVPEAARELAAAPPRQVIFNYLGRFTGEFGAAQGWDFAPESLPVGGGSDPAMPMSHVLEISAVTRDLPSGPQLYAAFAYASALLDGAEVALLADLWLAALRTFAGS
ncbi:amino acid adenylation domain-containing protein [Polymorphospora rubra]|uniref:amino acid adenylation domain-containing protein n=1 Tax=Polymorphospora rubra TaxID=338584 RepID=UPI0031DC676D